MVNFFHCIQEPGADAQAEAREDKSDTGRHRHSLCFLSKSEVRRTGTETQHLILPPDWFLK